MCIQGYFIRNLYFIHSLLFSKNNKGEDINQIHWGNTDNSSSQSLTIQGRTEEASSEMWFQNKGKDIHHQFHDLVYL